jgi:hypothetical protein
VLVNIYAFNKGRRGAGEKRWHLSSRFHSPLQNHRGKESRPCAAAPRRVCRLLFLFAISPTLALASLVHPPRYAVVRLYQVPLLHLVVAVQDEFERIYLTRVSLYRLKGWKPGAFNVWVNSIQQLHSPTSSNISSRSALRTSPGDARSSEPYCSGTSGI